MSHDLRGSPAPTREQLPTASPAARSDRRAVLIGGLGTGRVEETARPAGAPPAAEPTRDGSVETGRACLKVTPSRPSVRVAFAPTEICGP